MQEIKELLSQHFGVLTTHSEYPYPSLVAFSFDNMKELYFATGKSTRKYKNMMNSDKVSLMVFKLAKRIVDGSSLTAYGRVDEIKSVGDRYNQFLSIHKELKSFLSEPDCVLMRIKVQKYMLVTNFQEIKEFTP